MSDRNVSVEVAASPFWAVALILIWLHGRSDGIRVMNVIDPENKRPVPFDEADKTVVTKP